MEEAISLFSDNNLELRIARSRVGIERGEARQSRAYFNPLPFFYRENLNRDDLDYWETLVGLEQTLEWPGVTSARNEAANRRMSAAALTFSADSLRLAFEVRRVFVQAWVAEEREAALQDAAAAIREVTTAAERRFEEGDVSGYELRRLKVEQARTAQELAAARLRASAARRTLAALIEPDAESAEIGPAAPPAGPPPPVSRSAALEGATRRPGLRGSEEELAAARALAGAADRAWIPDPTLTLGYKDQSDGLSGLVFGVALPLPLFDQGRGLAQAADARATAAAARLDLHQRLVRNDVLAALDRYDSIRDRLDDLADGSLDGVEDLLHIARIAYDEGELGLVEMLDAAEAFLGARETMVALRAEAWIGYFDLLRAMGEAPENGARGDEPQMNDEVEDDR